MQSTLTATMNSYSHLSGTRHAASPRTTVNTKNSHPRAEQEEIQVNNQRHSNETSINFSPSHVWRTTNAHEQVTNNNPSVQ
ncbi:hypothetical protein ACFVTE_19160 [Arthrobacter sp. NPDC058097]|uniref:hypothetical protein n=1 Tax=Arthrobacter sp. NPDC058097 TaxID=3346340 RepID=UPI0036D93C76